MARGEQGRVSSSEFISITDNSPLPRLHLVEHARSLQVARLPILDAYIQGVSGRRVTPMVAVNRRVQQCWNRALASGVRLHDDGDVSGGHLCGVRSLCLPCGIYDERKLIWKRQWGYRQLYDLGHRNAFFITLTARHTPQDDPEDAKRAVKAQVDALVKTLSKRGVLIAYDLAPEAVILASGWHYHVHLVVWVAPGVAEADLRGWALDARVRATDKLPARTDGQSWFAINGDGWLKRARDFGNLPYYLSAQRTTLLEEMSTGTSRKNGGVHLLPPQQQFEHWLLMGGGRLWRPGGLLRKVTRHTPEMPRAPFITIPRPAWKVLDRGLRKKLLLDWEKGPEMRCRIRRWFQLQVAQHIA